MSVQITRDEIAINIVNSNHRRSDVTKFSGGGESIFP
jgi:hypothetical protein